MTAPHTSGRLRVLVVDHTAPVSSVRQRWARVARGADIDLTVVSPHAWPENSQWNTYQHDPTAPYRVYVGRVTVPGREVRSIYLNGLARAMRETRPDVIIMMEESFSSFAVQVHALKRMYAPKARVAFYACWILSYGSIHYRPAAFFRWLNRRMLPRFDAAMCINDKATAALHAEGFMSARTNFFGVDETLFTRISKPEARAATGLDPSDFVILYAGRLLEQKGLDDLIDAFAVAASARPEASLRLIVLGSGEYRDALAKRIAGTPFGERIELRGAVANEQIRLYMCAADVFVLPSRAAWFEQFGRVLAEAMLVEAPVIGSSSGEIPSVIGDAGYVYPADDVAALADTLLRVIDDPCDVARRVRSGRERALGEFSVDAFVRRTIALIEELSGRNVRRDVPEEVPA